MKTRRRFLRLVAGSAAVLTLPRTTLAGTEAFEWRGTALGAEASVTLFETDRFAAESAMAKILSEVARLERCFSLFDPDSEIVRLNETGYLAAASPDFRALLLTALDMAAASGGAFDPTVQPLWRYHADKSDAQRSADDIRRILPLVDYRLVTVDGGGVRFARDSMALTLNGIAQGYITDRAAFLLRDAGYARVLVQLGETNAWTPPGGEHWRIGIPHPDDPTREIGRFDVTDGAVATSSGAALRFAPGQNVNHLIDPRTGASPTHWRSVSVQTTSATLADGLSTALAIAPRERSKAIFGRFPGARLLALSDSGMLITEESLS